MTDKKQQDAELQAAHEQTRLLAEQIEAEMNHVGLTDNVLTVDMEIINDPQQVQALLIQVSMAEQQLVGAAKQGLSVIHNQLVHTIQQAMIHGDITRVVEKLTEIKDVVANARDTMPPALELQWEGQ